ncbi:SMP-30/gluconolactonase/LRE family protein [Bacteroidota bacterium]
MKYLFTIAIIISCTMSCTNTQNQNDQAIQIADSTLSTLGEGAIWDHANQRLFYIDIMGKKLFEFYPKSGEKHVHEMPSMIGTVVVKNKEEVAVALQGGIYLYNLGSKKLEFVACPPENDDAQRFNDGKCDPAGRFWVGTMSLKGGKENSHLFCMDTDGSIQVKLDGISISNGIVWSSDEKYMYYIDTPTGKVMEYAYDKESGTISNPRVAVIVADTLGHPDGMTIDAKDNLWVCMWGGSAVCCFDRNSGELLDRIMVPAKNITSCAFGGENLDQLYITTARTGTSPEELKDFPDAGALFVIDSKTRGSVSPYLHLNK